MHMGSVSCIYDWYWRNFRCILSSTFYVMAHSNNISVIAYH